MKKCLLLFGLILFSLSIGKALYFLKDGFSFRRIQSLNGSYLYGFDPEVKSALKQTFYYLGRGRQCFAFRSEDHRYVLKLLRTDIFSTPFWVRLLPFKTYRKKLKAAHLKKELFIRKSFALSYSDLKKQTGLMAVHLGQSQPSQQHLILIDALRCTHRLFLHKTSFVLQRKYPILMQEFTKALKNQNRTLAKKILDALVDVVVYRAKQGILNRDRSFLRNYGFDGEKAYQIDIGSFFKSETLGENASYQKSIRDSIDPVQEWLQEHDQRFFIYLNEKIDRLTRISHKTLQNKLNEMYFEISRDSRRECS